MALGDPHLALHLFEEGRIGCVEVNGVPVRRSARDVERAFNQDERHSASPCLLQSIVTSAIFAAMRRRLASAASRRSGCGGFAIEWVSRALSSASFSRATW